MKEYAGRVLMLLENNFPGDTRPRNEAATLTKAGYKVTVIALRKNGEKRKEDVNGVCVYRVPQITLFNKVCVDETSYFQRALGRAKSVAGYLVEYTYFTSMCFIVSLYISLKEGFDFIHAHNPPDTLFIIGTFYKMFGKRFIFDHHDLSPELYLTRLTGKKNIIYGMLLLFEKMSCKSAKVFISTNASYKQIAIDRHSVDPKKIYVVRNNPVINECLPQESNNDMKNEKSKKVLLFLGSINPQDGLDILMQCLHYLVNHLNTRDFICYIIGDGDSMQLMKQLSKELNLEGFVEFKGFITERTIIKRYLYLSDVCVEPAPDNELNRHSTFIKVMEYMAASKPIVAFDLKETRYSVADSAILVPPGDIEGFAHGIKKLIDEPQLREDLGKACQERIEKELNWEKASAKLLEAYETLNL